MKVNYLLLAILLFLIISCTSPDAKEAIGSSKTAVTDPLPSWNEGVNKQAIVDFVTRTTEEGSADFIPINDRIACFDNDGTLWSEQPFYFQFAYAIDRVRAMAPQHPEWKEKQPFKALLEGDMETALSGGEHAVVQILMTTHAGMAVDEFDSTVKDWIETAVHPTTGKHYNEMVYQPMIELLQYLRANEYKTFIVSGGGVDFMRAWTEQAYGIPPEQVVGSSGKVKYEVKDGQPRLIKLPESNFVDDKEGKPVGIHQYIGKRPVFTAGNSDGDYAMLQWTSTTTGYPRFGMIIHHTDSTREWAYDRDSHIGRLAKGLEDAGKYNWKIVDMTNDWKVIYPFELN
ncbi:HAD family hydrolase [Catalinimonas sp. 4WD22]|uniref:HAD family hydrolase n=1 Tax=Catalinimonas locisalis TaxID=3133978 RepID=UPI003100C0BC